MISKIILGCSVCFGASGSLMTKGLNMGILSLLVVIVAVLGCFGVFFFLKRSIALAINASAPAAMRIPNNVMGNLTMVIGKR